jgi:putative membrane protein
MSLADTPYRWSLHPLVLVAVAIVVFAYAWRIRALRAQEGADRGRTGYGRAALFSAGLVVLVLATVSPIDTLGEKRLFSVHMAQHLLLMDIAPILLLLGLSRPILRPMVRHLRPIEESLGTLAHPIAALVALVSVVWLWHIATMYELALRHPLIHELEHVTFLTGGLAFWWYVIEPVPPRHRLRGGWTLAYVSAAKLGLGALGVALAFSPNALYGFYERAPRTWGLSAVEDLNIGGLVMLVEQSVVLLIFFAFLFVRMLEQSEAAERRRERFEA